MVLIEILSLGGESDLVPEATILDYLQLITNRCDLPLKDDIRFWWKPFSYALLHPDQETSAFFVRSELGIQSEWPMMLKRSPYRMEEALLAVAISMDSMERFQLLLDYMQGFHCPDEYHLLPVLAAFAQCDKEAKLRFLVERAATLGLTETGIFQNVMWKVFQRQDEDVLKLLLDLDSKKSPLQQAVFRRWRTGISILIEGGGADVNYCAPDLSGLPTVSRYSPLKVLMDDIECFYIPPAYDSSENDHLIEELLVTGGARICEYDRKVFSNRSTDGGVSEGSEIEIALFISSSSDLNLEMNFDVESTAAAGAQFPADHMINYIRERSQVFFDTV
ncbi:hypothetical protein BCON_0403g00080 [Botryotinia convoluta]|uniref:Uncharacterized protein n=1 Tax=Botryotinia convoluta TaxID=54673 RepID=A0A4Z1H890_9HELO|nr:hypothetical protein BCON_0403g00080 [Botryotinia convoluta]